MGTQYYHPQAVSKVTEVGGQLADLRIGSCHAERDVARHYEESGQSPAWGDYVDYVNVEGRRCRWSPLLAIRGTTSKWLPETMLLPLKLEFERLAWDLGGIQAATQALVEKGAVYGPSL
jgi:hypothetical protein